MRPFSLADPVAAAVTGLPSPSTPPVDVLLLAENSDTLTTESGDALARE